MQPAILRMLLQADVPPEDLASLEGLSGGSGPLEPELRAFSPDGRYGYVCSSFNPETVVISVADHKIVGRVKQESPFCPNIAASPDGKQVWFTLKDIGKTQVFDAKPPFAAKRRSIPGPITNHVNFAHKPPTAPLPTSPSAS